MTNDLIRLIREYVDDHYKHFGFFPLVVKVDNKVYSWDKYWKLLDNG